MLLHSSQVNGPRNEGPLAEEGAMARAMAMAADKVICYGG